MPNSADTPLEMTYSLSALKRPELQNAQVQLGPVRDLHAPDRTRARPPRYPINQMDPIDEIDETQAALSARNPRCYAAPCEPLSHSMLQAPDRAEIATRSTRFSRDRNLVTPDPSYRPLPRIQCKKNRVFILTFRSLSAPSPDPQTPMLPRPATFIHVITRAPPLRDSLSCRR